VITAESTGAGEEAMEDADRMRAEEATGRSLKKRISSI
jgi:hypothetical protein